MNKNLELYTINKSTSVLEALKKIDANRQGFVIILSDDNKVFGVITDGDIRRALISGHELNKTASEICVMNPKVCKITDGFDTVTELFKNEAIKFLPIVDADGYLVNVITKGQMHSLLIQDIQADLSYDFSSLKLGLIDHEIFQRPWGFYKTTVLNDFYQGKIISVKPGGVLSLQSHRHREEYWIVVHGKGRVQLDESFKDIFTGSSVFIPKGCRHRVTNTDENENLIITEVQIGDFLGEEDIIRYEDIYGREVVNQKSITRTVL